MNLVSAEVLASPLGSAAALLADPVRRHVLTLFAQQRTITPKDVLREFPGMEYGVHERLTLMVRHGWLETFRVTNAHPRITKKTTYYQLTPTSRAHLEELYSWLGQTLPALIPIPEVHHDETLD